MATYGNLNVSTLNGGPLSGFRNAIINGNFGINQRAVSGTVTLAAGAYGHDRWKAGASGCTYTFATSENVTTLTISSGSLIQVVEGLNLMTGTYSLSWEGTAQGKIGAGSYGNSGITGSVTGGTNLNIEFGTGTLRLVQLEKGSVVTPFEFRSIGQERALCQRYCYVIARETAGQGGVRVALDGNTSGNQAYPTTVFKQSMRAGPSLSVSSVSHFTYESGTSAQQTATALSVDSSSPESLTISVTVGSSISGAGGHLIITTVGGKAIFSAEL